MSGITTPPIFQKPRSWDDCHCARAQDRFYEEYGYEFGYELKALWLRLRASFKHKGKREQAMPVAKPNAIDCC